MSRLLSDILLLFTNSNDLNSCDKTRSRWNTGTLAEQQNNGRTMGIPWNSGTCEVQGTNVTTKQHQEILPIQKDSILLSR